MPYSNKLSMKNSFVVEAFYMKSIMGQNSKTMYIINMIK